MTITRLPSTHEGKRPVPPSGDLCRPADLTPRLDVSGLIDTQNGLVDRAIFTDRRIYDQEQARVFGTSWLFLGHMDQLQKSGDFFTTFMGEDPIIVTKDKSGSIRAFLNSCRHRGARVLRADYGSTRAFTCTYHGWSYDLEGALISVPNEAGYPTASWDRSLWGLLEVAKLEVVLGLIFATWNPSAIPIDQQLGDMRWYLEAFLDRDSEGTTVVGGITKWVLKGNWKLAAEQFGTDWYHVNMSHASALMVLSPTGRGPKADIVNTPGRQYSDEHGNGAGFPTHPRSRFDAQPVHEYYDYARLRERLGDARVEGPMTTGHATVFPNFSYLPVNGSIRVWHPKGPDEMEVWAWTVLDKSMPEEVRNAQRLYNLRTFGPSGIFEQDDGENWSEIQAISHGWRTNSVPLNYQMGIGSESADGTHPGSTSELYSDSAGRRFYLPLGGAHEHPGVARGRAVTDEGIVVAQVDDIGDGEAIKIDCSVMGTLDDIAVFNDNGEFYALDDTCTHEKASLSEGWIEDGVIECPLHAGKFCLRDGSVLSMPATEKVACHRVVIDGQDIRVIPNPDRLG